MRSEIGKRSLKLKMVSRPLTCIQTVESYEPNKTERINHMMGQIIILFVGYFLSFIFVGIKAPQVLDLSFVFTVFVYLYLQIYLRLINCSYEFDWWKQIYSICFCEFILILMLITTISLFIFDYKDDKERIVMVVAFTFFDLIFLVLGWFFGIVCQNYCLLKYWPLGNFLIMMNNPGLLTYNRERDRMPIVPISSNV